MLTHEHEQDGAADLEHGPYGGRTSCHKKIRRERNQFRPYVENEAFSKARPRVQAVRSAASTALTY
ncbi:MAG: hypothetical protein DME65_13100 [Verrucomicrobia bacterium]|nr:MAG: hypothetical protein DME65_13100 [Verrucomicrobiota bacterium]